jgi:exosortase/archaeosortase family protein
MRRKLTRPRRKAFVQRVAARPDAGGDGSDTTRRAVVREQLRFVGLFALVAGSLFAVYVYPFAPGAAQTAFGTYMHIHAVLAGTVLRVLDHTVSVAGATITGRASLAIVRGCDAGEVVILYTAAVVATHIVGWGRRVVGVLAGLTIITCVNVGRICSLYFIEIHRPLWEETVHHEVWPLVLITLAAALYVTWAKWAQRSRQMLRAPQIHA